MTPNDVNAERERCPKCKSILRVTPGECSDPWHDPPPASAKHPKNVQVDSGHPKNDEKLGASAGEAKQGLHNEPPRITKAHWDNPATTEPIEAPTPKIDNVNKNVNSEPVVGEDGEFEKWLAMFVETNDHKHKCASYSEAQWCCLDKDHPNYPRIMAAHEADLARQRREAVEAIIGEDEYHWNSDPSGIVLDVMITPKQEKAINLRVDHRNELRAEQRAALRTVNKKGGEE